MGGMSCGDVSSIAWEILKNSTNYCLTISDEAISTAIALLAEARLSDEKIIGGECAVPGLIALISSFNKREYLDKLELNSESNILLFGCEGLTDKAMYQKLLSDGLQKI
jgi:diaminopropionate ammonia-lyase